MIIDFHTHVFPDALAPRAMAVLEANAKQKAPLAGTVSALQNSMQGAGVDRSVILQIATKPTQNHTVNAWAMARTEPGIIPFGSVHPDSADWESELRALAEAGIRGIKFHPEYQGFYVDDPKLFPLYELIDALGLIVVFHAGADIGVAPPVHGTPQHFARVVDRLPKGRTVLAHMGGWERWDEVESLLVGSHYLFDTSFVDGFLSEEQMRRIILQHGYEKILLGSDSPWQTPETAIARVKALALPAEAEAWILGGHACQLLKLTDCNVGVNK